MSTYEQINTPIWSTCSRRAPDLGDGDIIDPSYPGTSQNMTCTCGEPNMITMKCSSAPPVQSGTERAQMSRSKDTPYDLVRIWSGSGQDLALT